MIADCKLCGNKGLNCGYIDMPEGGTVHICEACVMRAIDESYRALIESWRDDKESPT